MSNELGILSSSNAVTGRVSDFEFCSIFWSDRTGAYEVHGDILKKYNEVGGPLGSLGFPTSDETPIPNISGAGQYNTFQKGAICWYGNWNDMIVVNQFSIFLKRIDSQEFEGAFQGQNDLYFRAVIKDGSDIVFQKRYPDSGDYNGRNIIEPNITFPPTLTPVAGRDIKFTLDIWESDGGAPFGGGDDHLGVYDFILNAANGWGFRNNQGVYSSNHFSLINNIEWSVKQQVNIAALTGPQKFWGVRNQGTDNISYARYASIFKGIDSEPEFWDALDAVEQFFYQTVVKDLAEGGNCFGMSLEAIYARKSMSQFSLPLDRFQTWSQIESEINRKHCYQVGSEAIWWFVRQLAIGNTHDPKKVFQESRNAYLRGSHPVICFSQNADFSGAPHCVLPEEWHSDRIPWVIKVLGNYSVYP